MPMISSAIMRTFRRQWTAPFVDFIEERLGRAVGAAPNDYFSFVEEFLADAGATLPGIWNKQDTSAAGSPTLDYVAGAAGGAYVLQHANTNEVENIGLNWNDKLYIDSAKAPIFECRAKIDGTAAAVLPAGTRAVFGLASARNATLDSVSKLLWFRVEGAGAGRSVLCESDDNTTDTDDQSTGFSYAEGTYFNMKIDASNLAAVKFYINGTKVKTLAAAAMSGLMQPFVELQKDSGTGTVKVTLDQIKVSAAR